MSDPVYKRILIKISGEALAGDKKPALILTSFQGSAILSISAPPWVPRSA